MRQFVAAAWAAPRATLRAMTSAARSCLGLVALSSLFAFAACGDDDDDGAGNGAAAGEASEAGAPSQGGGGHGGRGGSTSLPDAGAGGAVPGEGSLECQVLGELCHAADTEPGPAHDCHEVGHVGNAAACEAEFAGCVGICTDADIGGGGAGGAGAGDDPKCAALGSLCHEAGEIDAEAKECHEVGHVGNAANCAASFDSCATLCLAILDTIEGGGEGGAHAGGASSGGAASGGAGGAP
jgi:hypothetical protein